MQVGLLRAREIDKIYRRPRSQALRLDYQYTARYVEIDDRYDYVAGMDMDPRSDDPDDYQYLLGGSLDRACDQVPRYHTIREISPALSGDPTPPGQVRKAIVREYRNRGPIYHLNRRYDYR